MTNPVPYNNDKNTLPLTLCEKEECFQVSEIHISGLEASQTNITNHMGKGKITFGILYKRGISTINAIFNIKRGLRANTVGYGGLKDAHSISWQFVSIEGEVAGFNSRNIRFTPLSTRYTHMSTSEVWGNAFSIHLKSVEEPLTLAERFVSLYRRPLPAYYGPQRFGALDNDTHLVGLYLLKRDYPCAVKKILEGRNGWYEGLLQKSLDNSKNDEQALLSLPPAILRLFINAYQAHVFNRALEKFSGQTPFLPETKIMVATKDLNGLPVKSKIRLINGRVAEKIDSRQLYFIGSLPGTNLEKTTDEFGKIVTEVLSEDGLTPNDFRATLLGDFKGSMRQLYFWVIKPRYLIDKTNVWLYFRLHRGMYATVVLSFLGDANPPRKFLTPKPL